MKTFRNLTLVSLALSAAAMADPVVIRFAASNGDRNATQTALGKILTDWTYRGLSGVSGPNTGGSSQSVPSSVTGSNFGTFKGKFNGQDVIVKTNYAGALAGIAAVAGNTPQRFDPSNGDGTGAIANPLDSTNPAEYETGTVDFGLSTNFQATSPFNGDYEGTYYNGVAEETVGISPLGFYASPGFPAAGANITSQLARQLYSTGYVPLSLFTGDSADANKIVYAIGRNTDAGQRFGAYAEVGLGTQAVRVWQPTISGQTPTSTGVGGFAYGGTVTSHKLWPAETVSGIFSQLGSGGYNGGAALAPALTVTLGADAYQNRINATTVQFPNATAGYYIGYLTPGDANGRVLGLDSTGAPAAGRDDSTRGVALKYNGVELTTANIKSGRYTAWLYNRILRPQGGVADKEGDPTPGFRAGFVDALSARIKTVDAAVGGGIVDDSSVKVQRFEDGGLVFPK